MSRAATNIMGVLLSEELKCEGIPVQLLHPGFNRTTMTEKYKHIWDVEGAVPAPEGAKRVLYETLQTTIERTGTRPHHSNTRPPAHWPRHAASWTGRW